MTFVDTSAFVAVLITEDANCSVATAEWSRLLESGDRLITTNYTVVETCAVLHRRAGMDAVRRFLEDILPVVAVEWVDVNLHTSALLAYLDSARRGPSIVDCVGFAVMRKLNIKPAFAYDPHFARAGFTLLPARPQKT